MANDDQDLELDVGEGGEGGSSGGSKKFIIIGVAAVLLIGGGVAAFLLLGGEKAPPPVEGEEVVVEEAKGPAQYVGVPQAITANLPGKRKSRTVQIKMTFMVRSDEAREAVRSHMPQLKNDVLMLVSQQSSDEIKKPEGREKLQAQSLETVQATLKELVGKPTIEKVLFTSFVMQ